MRPARSDAASPACPIPAPLGPGHIASKPFEAGEKVWIVNICARSGRPFLEGVAHVLVPLDPGSDLYRVKFLTEPNPKIRFVHRAFQAEPHRIVSALLAIWREAMSARAIDEFFPTAEEA